MGTPPWPVDDRFQVRTDVATKSKAKGCPSPLPVPGGPPVCVGIDLAGLARRETGLALIRNGRLDRLETGGHDGDILSFVAEAGLGAVVAINAPLTRPL